VSIKEIDGHVYAMKEHNEVRPAQRRRHSAEFKAQVVKACLQPGASIAAVARHYQLNAQLLRRWVAAQQARTAAPAHESMAVTPPAGFIPLPISAGDPPSAVPDIVIEIKRGAAAVTVRWPSSTAAECASWLQGWLR